MINIQSGASLDMVHVWDGPNLLQRFTTQLSGDFSQAVSPRTTFTLASQRGVRFSLGISVHITSTEEREVTFVGAAAEGI